MRIVQTFWSGKDDLLENSYGWLDPQSHLMSWALSCLTLKEHYGEVVMYTDSEGKHVFGTLLGLPYTEIIDQYNDIVCPKRQWAYFKMLTYSMQKKPFIHVDGDVYLSQRLNSLIEDAPLIVQNREIGTKYYGEMINEIKKEEITIPDYLEQMLQKESIPSYNAGILGANDIDFIQRYCDAAFNFIETNKLLDINKNSFISHNILFEQILLYAIAAKEKKTVTTVLNKRVKDNGYSYNDFSDFYSFDDCTLMHIIGGHKRRPQTCELLSRTLLKKYPDYYRRIVDLFPQKHKRIYKEKSNVKRGVLYDEFIANLVNKWRKIPNEDLLLLDKKTCNYFEFLKFSIEEKLSTTIRKNPYLSLYVKGKKQNLSPLEFDIACIPSLLNDGFQTVPLEDLDYNILLLIDEGKTLKELIDSLMDCFIIKTSKREKEKMINGSILKRIEYLLFHKLIFTENKIDKDENE